MPEINFEGLPDVSEPSVDFTGLPDMAEIPDSTREALTQEQLGIRPAEEVVPSVLPHVEFPNEWLTVKSPIKIDQERLNNARTDQETIAALTGKALPLADIYDNQDSIDKGIEDSWGKIVGKSIKAVAPSFGAAVGGIVRAAEDMVSVPPELRDLIDTTVEGYEGPLPIETKVGQVTADYYGKILRELEIDAGDSPIKRYGGLIFQNVARNLPILGLGIITGSPAISLSLMGTQAGALKYNQLRDEGIPHKYALSLSGIVGIAEAATEAIPTEMLIKAGKPFVQKVLSVALADVPGELLATSIESVVDKVSIRPNMTLEEYVSDLGTTVIVALGSAGLLTTATHPITLARDARIQAAKDKEQFDIAKKKAIDLGLGEEEATLAGLDAVTTTPDGKEQIQQLRDIQEGITPAPETIPEIVPTVEESLERILSEDLTEEELAEAFESFAAGSEIIEEEISVIEEIAEPIEEPRKVSEIVKDINEVIGEKGSIGGQDKATIIPMLEELGQSVWTQGKTSYKDFKSGIKESVGKTWSVIKRLVRKAWESVKAFNERLGEVGAIGDIKNIRQLAKSLGGIDYNREHLKGELDKLKEDAPAMKLLINKKGKGATLDDILTSAIDEGILEPDSTLNDVISALEINLKTPEAVETELVKDERIRQRAEAKEFEFGELKKAFVEQSTRVRKAFREGKAAGIEEESVKLKAILARSRKVRLVRDYFNLTDADMKKISLKNPALMEDWEFKQYLDDVRYKSAMLSKDKLQKASLIHLIYEKDLGHVDNYRRVLGFPPISQMTTSQIQDFAEALEPFSEGDVFLSERQLETVERTELAGIATWREAKERLLVEINKKSDKVITMKDLEKIKIREWDNYKWDTSLAESNPFFNMLVTNTTRKLLDADLRTHEIENEVFALAEKSQKSRGLTFVEKAIPQDHKIFEYIQTPLEDKPDLAADMTAEQLNLAHYMQSYFELALEYLIKNQTIEKGRANYFRHVRKVFLENVSISIESTKNRKFKQAIAEFKQAIDGVMQSYIEDEEVFNILDGDTGNILPLDKFVPFQLRREGQIDPSENVVKVFLSYVQLFEKMVSLNELIPKMDIYAQSITPQVFTPRGLEADRSIKKFLNEWMNNKKGRKSDKFIAKQGGRLDLALRALKTTTTLIDIGGSLPVGAAAFVGETAANFTMLGIENHLKGIKRSRTKKGKAILRKYEAFVGRSAWEEFAAPGKNINERINVALFSLFHQSTVTANKHFLLGSITRKEYHEGTLSPERLATLKLEMGRFRVVPGTRSIAGSTSVGAALMQYKSWAAPVLRTNIKNLETIVSDLRAKKDGALTSKEAREIYRVAGQIGVALTVAALVASDEDDNSLLGQTLKKMIRESKTLLQGMDPTLWLGTPRLYSFIADLAKNLKSLVLMDEYKRKEGLKGVEGFKRQLTPRAIKQFQTKPKKRERL